MNATACTATAVLAAEIADRLRSGNVPKFIVGALRSETGYLFCHDFGQTSLWLRDGTLGPYVEAWAGGEADPSRAAVVHEMI